MSEQDREPPERPVQRPAQPPQPPQPPKPPPAPQKPTRPARPARPSAVLDEAHLGDIQGAFGRIPRDRVETARPGLKARLLTLLAIVGPGIIVMVGDNDAGGVATYAQAGQNHGYSLLWVLLLLIPVLIVNQEMVVRLGAVTGVGHARLIIERFGRFWGWFSVGDLFLLNFLTLVTEFIGISLAAGYLGVSRYVVVPVAALVLIGVAASGSFRRWERAMFVFIAASLLLVPLTLMSHPQWGRAAHDFVVPGIQGGASGEAVLLIIAMVGTTVAPWQLFFQQSNVIDKRITPRFIGYERADTVIGSLVVVAGGAALIMIADYAARGTGAHGHFTDAAGVAEALGRHDPVLGVLFAVVLLDASIIGAAAVTLATSYAFGDVFNLRHSLHRRFREARKFYASYSLLVLVAAAIVLIPGAPLGLITEGVQALAGLLLPSASVFLLLLCNDPEVLGPWVNRRRLNALAALIIAVLLMLSGMLMVTTLFPAVDVTALTLWFSIALAGCLTAAAALRIARRRAPPRPVPVLPRAEKLAWRMPPLALLRPVRWSPGTRLGMTALRAYLILGALLLLVKVIRLGGA
ncbi:NRAMP family divalent metal transporter [Streptomyces paludis]|uniref:Divalent metal cation transporter n=1 Tax=Streptomyces paludis TaxID=2282738 RepID=A0A345HWZ3_9ACTN|nr:NRAMP family divalent metal transporter [Streptomyces paludis]AXG81217.1 divalent metal cation transporter [Streptomyces paludis]